MVKGSVTISIDDFQAFLESAEKSKIIQEKFLIARKELQVFLSFLTSRENIEKYVEEFNRQSKTSKIVFESGEALIVLKDD
tara:strand:- start:1323 stop:1565 length:243 start_codon:yes stop_codon:yes gene_type:complete